MHIQGGNQRETSPLEIEEVFLYIRINRSRPRFPVRMLPCIDPPPTRTSNDCPRWIGHVHIHNCPCPQSYSNAQSCIPSQIHILKKKLETSSTTTRSRELKITITVPSRISRRWGKYVKDVQRRQFRYGITAALKIANVRAQKFKRCWFYVREEMSKDELFSLFKNARFDVDDRGHYRSRAKFVSIILQRYEDFMRAKVVRFSVCRMHAFVDFRVVILWDGIWTTLK